MTYLLEHVCRCGHVWRMSYEPGAVVHPTCPECDEELRLFRKTEKGPLVESIGSVLLKESVR